MSEEAKELQKKLFNKKENGVDFMKKSLKLAMNFARATKNFFLKIRRKESLQNLHLHLQKNTVLLNLINSASRLKQEIKFIISTGARQLFLQSRAKGLFVTE